MTEEVLEKVKVIRVTKYGVDQDPITLRKSYGQEAQWNSDVPFRIKFEKSPFSKDETEFKSERGVINSGPIKANASGPYKYSIKWEDGYVLDPRVIIDP